MDFNREKTMSGKTVARAFAMACLCLATMVPDWKKPLMAFYYQPCAIPSQATGCGSTVTCDCVMRIENSVFDGAVIQESTGRP